MKVRYSCMALGLAASMAQPALGDVIHTVGAPNNFNNPQPGQNVSEGSNPRTYFVETGDVVMLEKGDPNKPEDWVKTDDNWSDVIRFYNTANNGVAFMISDGENGIREASLPALGGLPAGQLAGNVEYILESSTVNSTEYDAVGSQGSKASYLFFSDPSGNETGNDEGDTHSVPDAGGTATLFGGVLVVFLTLLPRNGQSITPSHILKANRR
jgi:hypothetical protein